MPVAVARTLSILAHPLPMLAATLLVLAAQRGAEAAALRQVAIGCAVVAAGVMAYSWRRVRNGDWGHVDASGTGERRQLNRVLLLVLMASALVAALAGASALAWQLGFAALPVALAITAAPWCKLFLHVAFVVYAAVLLSQVSAWVCVAALVLAALVAWSRLRLARHAPRDLVAGTCAGAVAGMAMLAVAPQWQA